MIKSIGLILLMRSFVANSNDIASGDSNILIIGDSGTHKTRFIGGIPGIFVYDFDKGMASTRGMGAEYETFRDAPRNSKPRPGSGLHKWSEGWPAFIQHLNKMGELIDKGQGPKVIGLDSLTFMSELAMNNVVSGQKGPEIHQGSYGAQQQYLKQVLGDLTAWPIRLVATAHIQRNTNDITQIEEKLPLLTGKLAGFISAYFDEVWFTNSPAQGGQGYTFITAANPSIRQAKSRWNIPNGTKMDWAEVSKYLPDKAGSVSPGQIPAMPAKAEKTPTDPASKLVNSGTTSLLG